MTYNPDPDDQELWELTDRRAEEAESVAMWVGEDPNGPMPYYYDDPGWWADPDTSPIEQENTL